MLFITKNESGDYEFPVILTIIVLGLTIRFLCNVFEKLWNNITSTYKDLSLDGKQGVNMFSVRVIIGIITACIAVYIESKYIMTDPKSEILPIDILVIKLFSVSLATLFFVDIIYHIKLKAVVYIHHISTISISILIIDIYNINYDPVLLKGFMIVALFGTIEFPVYMATLFYRLATEKQNHLTRKILKICINFELITRSIEIVWIFGYAILNFNSFYSVTNAISFIIINLSIIPSQIYAIYLRNKIIDKLSVCNDKPKKQKKCGLIGGLSHHSTSNFYTYFNNLINSYMGNFHSAYMSIISIDFEEFRALENPEPFSEKEHIIVNALIDLKNIGCDYAVICCNTAHIFYDSIIEKVPNLPILHISDACAWYLKKKLLTKVLVIGTKETMTNKKGITGRLEKHKIEVIVPNLEQQDIIDNIIFNELVIGIINEKSKIIMIDIINQICKLSDIKCVILGCTELPLIIKQEDMPSINVIPTTDVLAQAALEVQVNNIQISDFLPIKND